MQHRTMVMLLASALAGPLHAQLPTLAPLTDFVGTYTLRPGSTIEIVAGDQLFAVLEDAKYVLRRVSSDAFLNGGGDTITFPRDSMRHVTAYIERGVIHPRLKRTVTAASAALASPRTVGSGAPDAYRYRAPRNRGDGIPVGDIRTTDLDVPTAELLVRSILDGTYKDVHSVLLFQRGRLVLEEYFYGYDAQRPHQMRSATKSVVSALAGIAIDRGAIASAEAPVTSLLGYPGFENADARKSQITLAHLMTMSPGLACNDYDRASPGNETTLYESADWVKATLDLPMRANPGSVAHYCSGGVAVVGRSVERAVRMTLPDFAQAHLFTPLGIARSDWRWNYTLTNANQEYSQIHLRPRDMLKIGMLYANRGMWRGTRVLSQSWVDASLREQTQIDGTAYGYFWWRPWLNVETSAGAQHVTFSAAQGNGGQKIYLVPELELIAVFTGGDYNSGAAPPNKIMARIVLPTLLNARAKH
jgi:CubicO group peptidase (beta-lactamase class C family)